MKNPLMKRIPRELKHDFAKYFVIFMFLVMLIALVSGFLVGDDSLRASYDEGFTKYNIEDGHVGFDHPLPDDMLEDLEEENDLTFYDLEYFEENRGEGTIRVYKVRDQVDLLCLMYGELPQADDEIALDRMYADNNDLEVGDTITLGDKELTVSGLVAAVDYSCLFESNADMMFDAINFSCGFMTEEGYEAYDSSHVTYNYAWKYDTAYEDDVTAKEWSDDFLEDLTDAIKEYDTNLAMEGKVDDIISVTTYLPRYSNKAINFTGEDMGSDKSMFIIIDYIITIVIAFVFAVTITNTISQESGVIGTLRASGYSRGEIIRHYLVLPMVVSLIAALIGNVLGYTWVKDFVAKAYMGSYSLATYVTLWSPEAFVYTTVVPLILMFVINLLILNHKLRLSPLRFLRNDLSARGKKKAFRLNTKIPIMHRFRLRIIFQNLPNYITLMVGVFFGAVLVIFGTMFVPLFDDYAKLIDQSKIANYQYVLSKATDTENEDAEKYCVRELDLEDERFMTDEILVYGITEDSAYLDAEIPEGQILVSNGLSEKYGLEAGDTLTLFDEYTNENYEFTVGGSYTYDAALSIFVNIDEFNETFDYEEDHYSGYFSDEELTDLDSKVVASVITEDDLAKISKQMKVSMGEIMHLFQVVGVVLFLLLMFLLSKQIIEKNAQSISMTKILGFRNGEIGSLYIVATSVVVVVALLISIPITDLVLRYIFAHVMYTMMTGYIPYIVRPNCYVTMVVCGICSYALVAIVQMHKIAKINKADALKNVE